MSIYADGVIGLEDEPTCPSAFRATKDTIAFRGLKFSGVKERRPGSVTNILGAQVSHSRDRVTYELPKAKRANLVHDRQACLRQLGVWLLVEQEEQ